MLRTRVPVFLLVFIFAGLGLAAAGPASQAPDLLRQAEEALRRQDFATADAGFRAVLKAAQESGDRPVEAAARNGLARSFPADRYEALAQLRLARSLHAQLGDAEGEAEDLAAMGEIDQLHGFSSQALQSLTEALAIQRRLKKGERETRILAGLASARWAVGSYEEALFDLEAALEASRRDAREPAEPLVLEAQLAKLNAELGRYDVAARHLSRVAADARKVRQRLAPAIDEPSRQQWAAQVRAMQEGKMVGALAQKPPAAAPPAEAAVALEQLKALARDYEEKSRQARERDRVLASTDAPVRTGDDLVANREFRRVWQMWIGGISPMLGDPGMKAMMQQIPADKALHVPMVHGMASFNRAALQHWQLRSLPETWFAEQARQINQVLRSNGYPFEVSPQEIAGADGSKAGSWRFGNWPPSMEKMVGDSFAQEADRMRGVAADPGALKKEMQDTSMLTIMAQARAMGLVAVQRVQAQVASGLKPELAKALQDDWTALACQAESQSLLGQIHRVLGNAAEADAARESAWDLAGELPVVAVQRGLAGRKLGLAVPPDATAGCRAAFFANPTPDLWASDLAAAQGHTEAAIEGYLSKAASDPSARPAAWTRIAALYARKGEKERALEFYRKAVDEVEALQGQLRLEQLVVSWSSRQEVLYQETIRLLRDLGRPELAFEYAERARARAFLNQIGNRRLPAAGVPPELADELHQVRQHLIEIESFQARGPSGGADRAREKEETRKTYEQVLARVARANPEYTSLVQVDVTGVDKVRQDVLDAGTTLIEYFVLDDKTLAWVIDRDQVRWVELPIAAADLHQRVDYLRKLIASRSPEAREKAGQLYQAVFAPLVPHVRHANLVIVPHGPLHYLPFAALYDESGKRYLVESHTLTLAPSASALRFVLAKHGPAATTLLALGDPDGSLPHAGQEARMAAGLYGGTPGLGAEARESRLHREAGRAGLLHLAAHAYYDAVQPLFTSIGLARGGGNSLEDERADGLLHVYEVYGLDLKQTSLVVLSACDTALGPRSAGDDLISLPRAFLYAGAPAVVTSLWPIDDDATATLMEAFYRRLRGGAATAEALRAAQLEILKREDWREPYFWAAFTLTGDWRGADRAAAAAPRPPAPAGSSSARHPAPPSRE